MLLFVDGNFKNKELKELKKILSKKDIIVIGYKTRAIEPVEIVRLIFRDFNMMSFLRNGILFRILIFLFTKAHTWIKKKRRKAQIQMGARIGFKQKSRTVFIHLGIPENNIKIFFDRLKSVLTINFVNKIKEKEQVSMTWDERKQKIKIDRF